MRKAWVLAAHLYACKLLHKAFKFRAIAARKVATDKTAVAGWGLGHFQLDQIRCFLWRDAENIVLKA